MEELTTTKTFLIIARTEADIAPALLHAVEAFGAEPIICASDHGEGASSTLSTDLTLAGTLQSSRVACVLVVGGDGTLRLAVDAVQHYAPSIPVVLLPNGTANDFARTIADLFPGNGDASLGTSLQAMVACDVGVVVSDGMPYAQHFMNMMVVGCGAESSQSISKNLKQIIGSAAYLTQFYHSLVNEGCVSVRVAVDDQPAQVIDCSAIFIANGRTCGGGYSIVPTADPTDGLLDLVLVRDVGIWEKLKLATSFVSDQHLVSEAVYYKRAKKVSLDFGASRTFTLDGECFQGQTVDVSASMQSQPLLVTQLDDLSKALQKIR